MRRFPGISISSGLDRSAVRLGAPSVVSVWVVDLPAMLQCIGQTPYVTGLWWSGGVSF